MQRSSKIEVRYQDLQGQQQEMQLSGFVARIFQHEYDHLQVGRNKACQPGGPHAGGRKLQHSDGAARLVYRLSKFSCLSLCQLAFLFSLWNSV